MVTASPLASCVLRLATVHGHPTAGELKQSVHRLLHQAAQDSVHAYAPTNWRPFIQREDAARAFDRTIRHPYLTGTFNLARDHATFYEPPEQSYGSHDDVRLNTAEHLELLYSTTTLITAVVPNKYGSLVAVSSLTVGLPWEAGKGRKSDVGDGEDSQPGDRGR